VIDHHDNRGPGWAGRVVGAYRDVATAVPTDVQTLDGQGRATFRLRDDTTYWLIPLGQPDAAVRIHTALPGTPATTQLLEEAAAAQREAVRVGRLTADRIAEGLDADAADRAIRPTEATLEQLVGRTAALYDREARHQQAVEQGRAYSAPGGRVAITSLKIPTAAADVTGWAAVFTNPSKSGVRAINQMVRQSATHPYLLRAWRINDLSRIVPTTGAKPVAAFNRGGSAREARCQLWAPANLTLGATGLTLVREEDFAAGMQEIDPRGVVVLPGRGTLYQLTSSLPGAMGGIDYHWDEEALT